MSKTYDEWFKDLSQRSDHDLYAFASNKAGGIQVNLAKVILEERRAKRNAENLKLVMGDKQKYTLFEWFKLANFSDKFGIISFFIITFVTGYLFARNDIFSRAIDLIRDAIP
jgi:hypothetical protein